jgi:UDP-hydrolysing UDP-N-acetyl-D-glucosamine 2-epimerase
VATAEAAARLAAMGEQRWRILQVGAPGLDLLATEAQGDLTALRARLGLAEGPYLLVVQHPETVGAADPAAQLDATLGAVAASGLPAVALFPNADAGGRAMVERLFAAAPSVIVVPSLPRPDFATLLAGAAALVGNSSSGIIEAPLLRIPAVNVGSRQEGRTRGDNVVDVAADRAAIEGALAQVLDPRFRMGLSGVSPYGDGSSAPRIIDALIERLADPGLLNKEVGSPLE